MFWAVSSQTFFPHLGHPKKDEGRNFQEIFSEETEIS